MRILICDDEAKCVNELRIHVEEYMKNHFIQYEIDAVTSPNDILEGNKSYDLIFLDIQMPEADGISVAKEFRACNSKAVIFFVTSYNKYQDEAMDLQAFRFFEKPFDITRLYSSLDKAMEYINNSYIEVFIYKGNGCKRILIDDIIYVKRENRRNTIYTKEGELVVREFIDEWVDRLPNTFFYLVHKSFYVNLHHVTQYNYTELYVEGNIRIPIASRKQADFHRFWYAYLKRR